MADDAPVPDEGTPAPVRRQRRAQPPAPAKTPRAKSTLNLSDLNPDTANRRQRTARGARMMVESLEAVGTARSIVIDEDNDVLAGNGIVEAAAEAGITRVRVIDTDGKTLIAVRRRGLSADDKRALALYDNRTAELAEWNPEQLGKDRREGMALSQWFEDNELKKLLADQSGKEARVKELETSDVADRFWIAIRGPLKAQAKALQRLREVLRELDDVEVDLGITPDIAKWGG